MRNINLETTHLLLVNKKQVAAEIGAQGVDKIINHLKWTSHIYLTFQEAAGRVVELKKTGKEYKLRDEGYFLKEVDESFAISNIREALARV